MPQKLTTRQFRPADAPRAASNRCLRRLWAAEVNRALRETGDPALARIVAARFLVAALDYADTGEVVPDAPVTLAGAAGRRQRWTAGPGEGAGEIAERIADGPGEPWSYEGEPIGRRALVEAALDKRRAARAAA